MPPALWLLWGSVAPHTRPAAGVAWTSALRLTWSGGWELGRFRRLTSLGTWVASCRFCFSLLFLVVLFTYTNIGRAYWISGQAYPRSHGSTQCAVHGGRDLACPPEELLGQPPTNVSVATGQRQHGRCLLPRCELCKLTILSLRKMLSSN